MTRKAHVCFLLHMHQPQYVDPTTGKALLPWVRLHGARAYLDVARILEDHPKVGVTVNFVPSLVAQLEAAAGGATDAWMDVALRPASDWSAEERRFLVEKMFSIHWGRSIEPRPRYRELLEKRKAAAQFSDGELRDATVLLYLSWLGFAARENDGELAALERRGRDFSHEDLALVLEKQRAACARVLPAWRKLAARGQVELSSSPTYHPIVPLLVDSAAARRARPDLPEPERFAWPEDAAIQIRRGAEAHARTFGDPPLGMWPPEGSVSPEAVALYAAAGVRWLATDEGNLWRSLDLAGRPHARGDLYRAWRHQGVDLLFRDREISDRIGFAYAHGDSTAGAEDLLARARACAAQSSAPPSEPALVPIFLDGENPWEAYPGGGEPFLRALFSGLERDENLNACSISRHLGDSGGRDELPQLHSGSWIDSDFHIWIGDPVKNRAWDLLGRVRKKVERARAQKIGTAVQDFERAFESILAAEGSDWFWWFGEPFHSTEDAIFDRLFRAHLAGALAAIGEPIDDELERPVDPQISGARPARGAMQPPYALIQPRIESGRAPSFYEWHGAGRFEVPRGAAMAETPLVERIHFGFDRERLYLRLDVDPARALEGELAVELSNGTRKLRLRATLPAPDGWTLDRSEGDGAWRVIASGGPAAAAPGALLVAVPFARLGVGAGARLSLVVRITKQTASLLRQPAEGAIELVLPDDKFEAENWSA